MDLQTISKQMVKAINDYELDKFEDYGPEIIETTAVEIPNLPHQAATIHSLLEPIQPLPAYSTVFGTCDDGVPFLMDLRDPAPGSLLILGDQGSGKARLLRTILRSASLINHPDKVSYALISANKHNFFSVTQTPHCIASGSPYNRDGSEIVMEMSAITEQRRNGRNRGAAIILAIDDLSAFAGDRLDYDVFVHFKWLLEEGPKSYIRPIVTLNAQQLTQVDKRILSAFGTLFISSLQDPQLLEEVAGGYTPSLHSLHTGHQFAVRYAGEWTRFALPAVVE